MKRKVEESNENARPVSRISGNPKKRLRSTKEEKFKEDSDQRLLEELGVKELQSTVNESKSKEKCEKVLQPHDSNAGCGEDADSGLGLGVGSWGEEEDSFNCSASSVWSNEENNSYTFPSGETGGKQLKLSQYLVPSAKYLRSTSTSSVAKVDRISQLSDEVILAVFKWLPKCILARCARVCKRWHRLTLDESLWRRLDLGMKSVVPGILCQVLDRGCQILRLSRSTVASPAFTDAHEPVIPSKLQFLDLSMTSISNRDLETLLRCCSDLRKFSYENGELTDNACGELGSNLSLEVLHLGGVSGISSLGIQRILKGCRKLTELNVGWSNFTSESLEICISNLPPSLERLCLAGNRGTLTDDLVRQLCENTLNLKELDISDSGEGVTGNSLTQIISSLTHLESLSTSRCYYIPPSCYLHLVNEGPKMQYLNVFGVLREPAEVELKERLKRIELNKFKFTSVARPTVGIKRTSIWNLRVRD